MSAEPAPVAHVVKPLKSTPKPLHLIALDGDSLLIERTGERFDASDLAAVITTEPSSLIVAEHMGDHIGRLCERFRDSEDFQYKLTPIYRDSQKPGGKSRAVLRDTVTTLIGFPGKYHHPLDPLSFIRKSLQEIDPSNRGDLEKLLEFGRAIRSYCMENGFSVKPSAGGIAAQLLRDPRFYPAPRRKAPKLLNRKIREKLPGNYYQLHVQTGADYRGVYLDMENSHHFLASQIEFPCVNSFHAYGFFETERPRVWATAGSARFDAAIKCPGLFHVSLAVPHLPPGSFPPPYMESVGTRKAWIYSNELETIRELGGRIEAIHAAIISRTVETGLNKYAEYAIRELAARPQQKPWLKPLLHSVYGVLAGRPRPLEIGWRRCNGGVDDIYPMGNKMIPVKVVKSNRPIEPKVVNAIHRGMIEAQQRIASLALARLLHSKGGEVLCVYADSVFVDMQQLPLLPQPWRIKTEVTNLRFLSATQFISPQLTRLPGVPRHLQDEFAPALRTRAPDPASGRPVRADAGSRIFRPSWSVDLVGQSSQKKERVKYSHGKVIAGDPHRQGRGNPGEARRPARRTRR